MSPPYRILLFLTVGQLFMPVAAQRQYVQWNVDERCPPDGTRRKLILNESEHEQHLPTTNNKSTPSRFLRVNPIKDGDSNSRNLQASITFNLKLYWQPGYCWQREYIERKWCLQCHGSASSCEQDSNLFINTCNPYEPLQRFEWIQLGVDPARQYQNQGLIKVATGNLCLQQTLPGIFRLRECNQYDINQGFSGFNQYGPFQLRPAHADNIGDCLTQDHHPTPGEELITQPCSVAIQDRTSYWQVYEPSESVSSIRFPACSPSLPCKWGKGANSPLSELIWCTPDEWWWNDHVEKWCICGLADLSSRDSVRVYIDWIASFVSCWKFDETSWNLLIYNATCCIMKSVESHHFILPTLPIRRRLWGGLLPRFRLSW